MVDKRSIAKGLVLSLFLACAFNFYFAPDSFTAPEVFFEYFDFIAASEF